MIIVIRSMQSISPAYKLGTMIEIIEYLLALFSTLLFFDIG